MDSGKKRKKLTLVITTWMAITIFIGNLSFLPIVTVDTRPTPLFYEKDVAPSTTRPLNRKISSITEQTTRASITIIGNANFTSANGVIGGNGTEQEPYLIANWFIDGGGVTNCIQIVNTTSYFRIENCTSINAGGNTGISLTNVSNGHLRSNECNTSSSGIHVYSSSSNTLTKNTCNNNVQNGIYLESSSSNTLTSNICNSNTFGIMLIPSSSSNTLFNNTCNSNTGVPESAGIFLYSSSNSNNLTKNICNSNEQSGIYIGISSSNTLTNNTCNNHGWTGILIASSDNNSLTDNNCTNNGDGIALISSSSNNLTSNICNGNGDYGIHFYSSCSSNILTSNICDGNTLYGIWLESSPSNILTNNFCNNNTQGINLDDSSSNTLTSNICNNNTLYGIWLESSPSNILANNFCNYNTQGINLDASPSNTLTNNTCNYNENAGINLVSSTSNTLTNNTCNNNSLTGVYLDSSSTNSLIVNFLSNNTNEGIYIGTGSINNIIHNNWIWDNSETIVGDWNNNDVYWNFYFSVDTHDIDHDGLTDAQELAMGTNLFLPDTDGDNFMDGYECTYGSDPLDGNDYPIPPTVVIISPTSSVYGQTSFTLTYSVSEGTVTIYTNGIANTTAQPSGSLLFGLMEGANNVTIVVVDHDVHVAKQTILFTIDLTPPTVVIAYPTSTTYTHASFPLSYTVSEGKVTVYINGVANVTAQPSGHLLSDLTDGTYTITIIAVDLAGNIGLATVNFVIDTTPLTTTTVTTPTATTKETSPETSSTTTSTTSEAASGSFPGVFTILLFATTLVVVIRRTKKT